MVYHVLTVLALEQIKIWKGHSPPIYYFFPSISFNSN